MIVFNFNASTSSLQNDSNVIAFFNSENSVDIVPESPVNDNYFFLRR